MIILDLEMTKSLFNIEWPLHKGKTFLVTRDRFQGKLADCTVPPNDVISYYTTHYLTLLRS